MRATGKSPSGKQLEQLKRSPNYKGKSFVNLSPTKMIASDASYWKMIKDYFRKNRNTAPSKPIPSAKTDLTKLDDSKTSLVWFGHSSYLLHIEGKNILVDPVFSGNAAPLSFMVRAFPGTDVYGLKEMPSIDILLLTHDHYDHLDYKTISELGPKVGLIITSLGVSSHLVYWGIDKDKIIELDWWQSHQTDFDFEFTATPARHFSGRTLKRNQTLWSSFILKTKNQSIYLGGDSGYDTHFEVIGKKYGPFDLAILEAGQYNLMWPQIHMMPEETVQAAEDLNAKLLLPVHWGKFVLGLHEWREPIRRVLEKASQIGMMVATPMIGEPLILNEKIPQSHWWEDQ